VWFGKQILVAILGVALAERARAGGRQFRNIEIANAVEALACWLALDQNGWQSDSRLLGRLKMQGKTELSFRKVRQQGFYVTQPMRMRTVQPLLALGFVDAGSERFNSFVCTEIGRTFIEVAYQAYRPKNRSVLNNLLGWMQGDDDCVRTDHSRRALSPTEPLRNEAREILRERIIQGPTKIGGRRSNLLEWMDELGDTPNQQITWDRQPKSLEDDHWRDVRVGGHFFVAREAAFEVLDSVEMYLGNKSEQRLSLTSDLPDQTKNAINTLRERSQMFLKEDYDPSPGGLAKKFCKECSEQDAAGILKNLVMRDGRVLQLSGNIIVPGAAFRGVEAQKAENEIEAGGADDGAGLSAGLQWPEGISVRIQNLFLLNTDLRGDLDHWLNEQDGN
jgi:hypothetical protein